MNKWMNGWMDETINRLEWSVGNFEGCAMKPSVVVKWLSFSTARIGNQYENFHKMNIIRPNDDLKVNQKYKIKPLMKKINFFDSL